MPQLPDGEPAPASGELPTEALATVPERPLAFYVHVPFCRVRCGYCDFNTYTPGELGSATAPVAFVDSALIELDLAAKVLGAAGTEVPRVDTVFFGGGTPTMLPAADLGRLLHGIRDRFGLAADAEVTTEANPDSIDTAYLSALQDHGFTRISLVMQSAVPHVLATLDRTHDPANVARAVAAAREVGLAVSLDLIYGTPGESLADWGASLDAAIALEPDHISAYALTVEEGTKLAAQVRRGIHPAPDPDDEAEKYALADERLAAAGFAWYEISNWARRPQDRCRHNVHYWAGANWWGIGPGAHSHVGGVRWWNVKHPSAYAGRLASAESPAAAREILTDDQREDERVLLSVRLADGLPIEGLTRAGREAVAGLIAQGLIEGPAALRERRIVLTRQGRLLADLVVRHLLGLES